MLSYVAVGLACGVLADQAGTNGLECFLLSATYLSESGQFMISNLWLQGMPIASLAISVCAVSSRFALYSASLAPALARFSKRESLAIASAYAEEATASPWASSQRATPGLSAMPSRSISSCF